MPLSAVYIDGGYLTNVLRALGKPRIDYAQFAAFPTKAPCRRLRNASGIQTP